METNLIAAIGGIALIQFLAIFYLVRRFYKDTQVDYIALNSRMEKQGGILANLNGMFAGYQKHIAYFDEAISKQQNSLSQLAKTIEAHQKNLSKIDNKVAEFEKAGDLFKSLFDELPAAIGKYKDVMSRLEENTVKDLEKAESNKDKELIKYQQQELDSITVRKKLIDELPGYISHLKEALNPVNERLKLFSGKDKYPTGTILSYPARRARTFLATIGEQPFNAGGPFTEAKNSAANGGNNDPAETIITEENSEPLIDKEAVAKVTRKRSKKSKEIA